MINSPSAPHVDPSALMFGEKFVSPGGVDALLDGWRKSGRRPVVAAGCFDMIHVGCVRFAADAAKRGDKFLMAVLDDAAVGELRGEGRPVLELRHRLDMVAALDAVDAVTPVSLEGARRLAAELGAEFIYEGHAHPQDNADRGADKLRNHGAADLETCADWLIKTIRKRHGAATAE